jgi:hypothetical protein
MSSSDLDAMRAAFASGTPDARERLKQYLAGQHARRDGHPGWARLCEELGEPRLALTEYQLVLRDEPDSLEALERLSVLYEERGELDRATASAERRWQIAGTPDALTAYVRLLVGSDAMESARQALESAPARGLSETDLTEPRDIVRAVDRSAASVPEPDIVAGPLPFTDSDVVRFAHLFSGRENVYARQWATETGEVGYSPVREPFTVREARNHLLGSITAGVYLVRLDNTVTVFAIDVDITKRAIAAARGSVEEARRLKGLAGAEARRLHDQLAALGIASLLEDSGYKGRHLWIFLEDPEPASVVRQFGTLVLSRFGVASRDLHAEFFPKQASVASGIGNLIKLPLGIHRKNGRRSRLLLPDGTADPDPFGSLRRQPRVTRAVLHGAINRVKVLVVSVAASDGDDGGTPPQPVPAPPDAAPAWTAADFETQPEIAHLLARCAVLAALKRKADENRRLANDERLVLLHTMGHSGAGVLAVNYILDECVDTPAGVRLQSPLSGNPMSCPKIRKRIPHITGSVACHCSFHFAPEHYPTPRLHLLTLKPAGEAAPPLPRAEPAWDPVDRTRALGVLWATRDRLAAEIAVLERELMAWMEQHATAEIDTGDGVLSYVQEPGAPAALSWHPKTLTTAAPAEPAPAPSHSVGGDSTPPWCGSQPASGN